MRAEKKMQIKAIKTGNYRAGMIGEIVMITDGSCIVYMPERDCMIDISKVKEIPKRTLRKYSAERIKELLKPVRLTNKARVTPSGGTLWLFEDKETKERIWINDKYLKMFQSCECYSLDTEEGCSAIVHTRYGKIIGLTLPVRVSEGTEGK